MCVFVRARFLLLISNILRDLSLSIYKCPNSKDRRYFQECGVLMSSLSYTLPRSLNGAGPLSLSSERVSTAGKSDVELQFMSFPRRSQRIRIT